MEYERLKALMVKSKTEENPYYYYYWNGYRTGLRRKYHGNRFQTNIGHDRLLRLAQTNDSSKSSRNMLEYAEGYADGFAQE